MPAVAGLPNKPQYRVIADTNILISAFLYGGRPEQVLRHILSQQAFVTSGYIIDELVGFLKETRPKAPQKWIRLLRQKLEVYCYDDMLDTEVPIRDSNDIPILKLAIKQRAVLVTNDKDLLECKNDTKVLILSTAEYCELFELDTESSSV